MLFSFTVWGFKIRGKTFALTADEFLNKSSVVVDAVEPVSLEFTEVLVGSSRKSIGCIAGVSLRLRSFASSNKELGTVQLGHDVDIDTAPGQQDGGDHSACVLSLPGQWLPAFSCTFASKNKGNGSITTERGGALASYRGNAGLRG